jgi:hypothetical protein
MTSLGHPSVKMPIVVRCPNGKMGGFNFAGMGPKSSGGSAGSMPGMSHGGPTAGAPTQHSKRQGRVVSVFVGQGDDGTAMTYRQKGSNVNSGYYVQKTDQFNLMSYVPVRSARS